MLDCEKTVKNKQFKDLKHAFPPLANIFCKSLTMPPKSIGIIVRTPSTR